MDLPAAFVEILKAAPYVGIIIWYTLLLLRNFRDELTKRDVQASAEREKRDAEWREFLAQQSNGQLKAIDEVAINLKELATLLQCVDSRTAIIHEILENHDRHAEDVARNVATMTARRTPKVKE